MADPREAKRREFILEHTGKGRLAGQDAILHSSGLVEPFPGPPAELSESVTISEFFSEEMPQSRRDSVVSNDSIGKKNSVQKGGEEDAPPSKRSSLRISMLKNFGSRRSSVVDIKIDTGASMSRSASANGIESECITFRVFELLTDIPYSQFSRFLNSIGLPKNLAISAPWL